MRRKIAKGLSFFSLVYSVNEYEGLVGYWLNRQYFIWLSNWWGNKMQTSFCYLWIFSIKIPVSWNVLKIFENTWAERTIILLHMSQVSLHTYFFSSQFTYILCCCFLMKKRNNSGEQILSCFWVRICSFLLCGALQSRCTESPDGVENFELCSISRFVTCMQVRMLAWWDSKDIHCQRWLELGG